MTFQLNKNLELKRRRLPKEYQRIFDIDLNEAAKNRLKVLEVSN